MINSSFTFASRLSVPVEMYATKNGIKRLSSILKRDYCFNIEKLLFLEEDYIVKVILSNKARKSEYEWVKEIFKYNLPIGILVEVE